MERVEGAVGVVIETKISISVQRGMYRRQATSPPSRLAVNFKLGAYEAQSAERCNDDRAHIKPGARSAAIGGRSKPNRNNKAGVTSSK